MCLGAPVLGFGLQALGQVASFAGAAAETANYNAAAEQNAINASLAMQSKTEDEQRRLSYDTKQNIQEGYDAVMKARQAKGTAIASAGSAGLDASSLSVDAILSNISNQEAMSELNTKDKIEDQIDAYRGRTKGYYYEAMGRINSMPPKAGPNPLGLAIGIAQSGLNAATNTNSGKNWLGIS